MQKQKSNLIRSLVVLALLCAAFMYMKLSPKTLQTMLEQENMLPEFSGAVEQVRITRPEATVELSMDGIEGIDTRIIDNGKISSTLAALSDISPDSLVEKAPENATKYGFDDSETDAVISYEDGNQLKIRLGKYENVSGDYYCRFNDEKDVYMLNNQVASALMQTANDFLSLQITPECRASYALSAVGDFRLERKEEDILIHACRNGRFEREALSFGAVSHIIEGPGVLHELDRTEGERLFRSLFDLKAREIVGLACSEDELSALGFDEPDAVVRYSLFNGDDPETPEEKQTLNVVFDDEDTVLMTVDDTGIVYLADRPTFLDADYAHLVMRQFVSPLMTDVARLEIGMEGERRVYEIDGKLKVPTVTCDGKSVNIPEFRKLYTLAVSAASNGELCESAPEGVDPILTIRYVYRDAEKADDFLEFYPADARYLFVKLNGAGEFMMRQRFAEVMYNAVSSLEEGVSIETNW